LSQAGLEVVLEDRPERPGAKFKDADLTGIPLQIVVGKHAGEGKVEIRLRGERQVELATLEAAVTWCLQQIK
jgi:prolyl-tRNA synthetase